MTAPVMIPNFIGRFRLYFNYLPQFQAYVSVR